MPKAKKQTASKKNLGKGTRSLRAERSKSKPWDATSIIPLGIIGATAAAYGNSFAGPFIFDDVTSILDNPNVQRLWPIWQAMWAPAQRTVSGRPVVSLSLALNYGLNGFDVWGYHAFNLAIHILNALLVFGIVHRTTAKSDTGSGHRREATWLAGAAALIWVVHPLVSETVDYIIQRTELLMAFFFLLTLWAILRGSESSQSRGWHAAAVVFCALGMGCKEVMAAAPLVILLFDRTFLSQSYRNLLRLRWGLYVGFAATWLLLAALLATGPRTKSVGFGFESLTPWKYLLTQADVIVHYLRLAFWPYPLCADYSDWPVAGAATAVLPQAVIVLTLLALSLWALRKKPALGFLGAWFFLILAPSSSLIPITTEVAAERRMYLPLLAVVLLVLFGAHRILGSLLDTSKLYRAELALVAGAVLACIYLTVLRNETYQNEVSIYSDVVAKRPHNVRALNNLGSALGRQGRLDEAMVHFSKAVALQPDNSESRNNLGAALLRLQRMEEASIHLAESVRLKPENAIAHYNLALALQNMERVDEAISHYAEALRLIPGNAEIHNRMGAALSSRGRAQEAIAHYREALRLRPDYTEARRSLEAALAAK